MEAQSSPTPETHTQSIINLETVIYIYNDQQEQVGNARHF